MSRRSNKRSRRWKHTPQAHRQVFNMEQLETRVLLAADFLGFPVQRLGTFMDLFQARAASIELGTRVAELAVRQIGFDLQLLAPFFGLL